MTLNEIWEEKIKSKGADFVCFVDAKELPGEAAEGYVCAVLFGKALSREYVNAIRNNIEPKTKEVINTERKMDTLAVKIAAELETEGWKSVGKLKTGLLPHKTAALRAGIGFIGKNNLLITEKYGCALMLGKVLTEAPFETFSAPIIEPKCGDCDICVKACPANALHGKTWELGIARDEIITRKLCTLCLKCMVMCPYTARYAVETEKVCSCKRTSCERHGDCAACKAHHAEKGSLTACEKNAGRDKQCGF